MLIGQIDHRCPCCGSSEIDEDWIEDYYICAICNKSFEKTNTQRFKRVETLSGLKWERV